MINPKLALPILAVALAALSTQVSAAGEDGHDTHVRHHVIEHHVIDHHVVVHERPAMGHCMMSGLSARNYRAEMKDTSHPLSMAAIEAWNRKNNRNYGGGCAMPTG